jgi:hypothetical protein
MFDHAAAMPTPPFDLLPSAVFVHVDQTSASFTRHAGNRA